MSVLGKWLGYSYRRRMLDRSLFGVAPQISGAILDVGGTRNTRGRFSSDFCSGAASWTRLNVSSESSPDVIADGHNLPVRDSSIDTVLCMEVLEYVDSPSDMLKELARVLRSGGTVIFSVPFIHRVDSPGDRWRFSENWVSWQIKSCGLRSVQSDLLGGPLATCAQILKTSILQISFRPLRALIALLAFPFLEGAFFIDQLIPGFNQKSGWTTGQLIVAKKP